MFSDDDEDLESAPPDSSSSSDESGDDDDDDGDDGKTTNTDDHGKSDPEMDVESTPAPDEQQERSAFGPMRSARRLSGRRQPAPMPEPLKALHRIVTAPAPVPSGRTSRAAADPAAPPPLPPSP